MNFANVVAFTLIIFGTVGVDRLVAGPPFVTDDPEPVEFHHWEFYLASETLKVPGDWSGTAPHVEVNYGAAPDLQLHLIAPVAYDAPSGEPFHYGYGDTELGLKYRFIQETNYFPQVGIFPLVEAPTGNATLGNGPGHWEAFLPLWAQKSWGTWTAYGGAGYGINSISYGEENWNFVGGLIQKQVLTNWAVGVEVFHQSAAQIDFPNTGTAFNVGTIYDFSEQHHLLFSVGRSIKGPNAFECYLAYQFTFDNSFFHFWQKSRHDDSP